jgi:hypothetical protein
VSNIRRDPFSDAEEVIDIATPFSFLTYPTFTDYRFAAVLDSLEAMDGELLTPVVIEEDGLYQIQADLPLATVMRDPAFQSLVDAVLN